MIIWWDKRGEKWGPPNTFQWRPINYTWELVELQSEAKAYYNDILPVPYFKIAKIAMLDPFRQIGN